MIKEAFDSINGYTEYEELECICKYVQKVKYMPGIILETGSWEGKSTIQIGNECNIVDKEFISIDDFSRSAKKNREAKSEILAEEMYNTVLNNIKKYNIKMNFFYASTESFKSWNTDIALLFHDSAHDFETVKKDLEMLMPKIKGYIILHDYTRDNKCGVKKAAESVGLIKPIEIVVSMGVFKWNIV